MQQSMHLPWAIAAWQNEREGWAALGQVPNAHETFRVDRTDGLICAWWQRDPSEMDNYLLVDPTYRGDLASLLDSVADQVKASPAPASLRYLGTGAPASWRAAAQFRGFTLTADLPIMVCPLDLVRTPLRHLERITVRQVTDHTGYDAALEIVQDVFGGPEALTRFFNPYTTAPMFLGCWEGEPVTSATVWPFAGVAGVYSVATRAFYRRRGLSLAVLDHLLRQAQAQGFHLASLRTSDSLVPLYEGAGFRTVGRLHCFSRLA